MHSPVVLIPLLVVASSVVHGIVLRLGLHLLRMRIAVLSVLVVTGHLRLHWRHCLLLLRLVLLLLHIVSSVIVVVTHITIVLVVRLHWALVLHMRLLVLLMRVIVRLAILLWTLHLRGWWASRTLLRLLLVLHRRTIVGIVVVVSAVALVHIVSVVLLISTTIHRWARALKATPLGITTAHSPTVASAIGSHLVGSLLLLVLLVRRGLVVVLHRSLQTMIRRTTLVSTASALVGSHQVPIRVIAIVSAIVIRAASTESSPTPESSASASPVARVTS